MTFSRTRRSAALTAALALASVSVFSSGLTADAADPAPSVDRNAANDALARVRDVFEPVSAAVAGQRLASGGVEVTMALRELAEHADSLSESDREAAAGYLARPTDGNDGDNFTVEYGIPEAPPVCTPDLCVHYVIGSNPNGDAPSLTDTQNAAGADGANGIPDYVDKVVLEMANVHDTYVDAGYREPRPDGTRGGDARIDIYLAELGAQGVYGYCTTDQPNPSNGPAFYDRWAYCVLDDDYDGFPNTALENIQVTAAHEYFHATQYAYDAFEDAWFLEATATWAEDEVYDDVNDNVQYLQHGPMNAPFTPLDTFQRGGLFHYGTWSFFRFLTEKYGANQGGMPKLVLDMMEMVDGSLGAPDQYSWQAVETVLTTQQTTAAKQFLAFSVANRRPQQTYNEGSAQQYPTGPLAGSVTLTSKKPRTNVATVTTDHLTSATYRFTPKNLKWSKTKLRVSLDMAPKTNGSMAAITMVPKKGKAKVYAVKLNNNGNGTKAVPFSSEKVQYVEVTLANTSGDFTKCYRYVTPFSCNGGTPKYDRQKQRISGRVVR